MPVHEGQTLLESIAILRKNCSSRKAEITRLKSQIADLKSRIGRQDAEIEEQGAR